MHHDDMLDATGLTCPMPLLKMKLQLKALSPDQILHVIATDSGSWKDFHKFAEITNNELLKAEEVDGQYQYWIKKGTQ